MPDQVRQNSKAKEVYEVNTRAGVKRIGFGCENKSNFFSELKNKRIFTTTGTVDGKTVKNVVKGYVVDSDFKEITASEDVPFH